MKTQYPYRMQHSHAKNFKQSRKKALLFLLFIALTVFAFAGRAPKLDSNLQVNLFNATLDSSKTLLEWESGMEKDLSHYVVERSLDANQYQQVTMIPVRIIRWNEQGTAKQPYSA